MCAYVCVYMCVHIYTGKLYALEKEELASKFSPIHRDIHKPGMTEGANMPGNKHYHWLFP